MWPPGTPGGDIRGDKSTRNIVEANKTKNVGNEGNRWENIGIGEQTGTRGRRLRKKINTFHAGSRERGEKRKSVAMGIGLDIRWERH